MSQPPVPRLVILAGSARRESFNRRLAAQAASLAAAAGADVDHVELAEFPLPLFNQDLEAEQGLPENARLLKQRLQAADALLLACPEYNSSITPLLKNVIDWCSRTGSDDEPSLSAYRGKVAAIVSASPGALGGLRGLRHVREILSNLGVLVIPEQFALSSASSAFAEDGTLKDDAQSKRLSAVVQALIGTASALAAKTDG